MIGRDEAHIPQSEGVFEIAADTSNSMNLVGGRLQLRPRRNAAPRQSNGGPAARHEVRSRLRAQHPAFRCDHLPFLLAGVPAVWIFGGFHPGYHEPSDTMERLNYPKIVKAIELADRAALDVADADAPPRFFRGP